VLIVCNKLSLSFRVFALSFEIFDKIIESYEFKLTDADLFLIVITSMYISAKYEGDKRKLTIERLMNGVAKGRFAKKEILQAEILILKILKFIIPQCNALEFISLIVDETENFQSLSAYFYKQNLYKSYIKDYFKTRSHIKLTEICALLNDDNSNLSLEIINKLKNASSPVQEDLRC